MKVGEESDDGVGWEEGALRSLKEREWVEEGDGSEVGGGFVGEFIDWSFKGVNDGLNFSVSVIDSGLSAEVQFHGDVEVSVNKRYVW